MKLEIDFTQSEIVALIIRRFISVGKFTPQLDPENPSPKSKITVGLQNDNGKFENVSIEISRYPGVVRFVVYHSTGIYDATFVEAVSEWYRTDKQSLNILKFIALNCTSTYNGS